MSPPLVVVWLGGAFSLSHHEPDLRSWSEARLVALEDAAPDAPLPPASHADAVAGRLETLLGEARAALFGADGQAAAAALDAAERELDSHPELPQAAFLLAELWRTRSALLLDTEPEAAAALLRAAEDMEGPVAAAFGARSLPAAPESAPIVPGPMPLLGPRPEDVVYVDGKIRSDLRLPPGRHHVRVLRGERVAWSGWVTVGEGPAELSLTAASSCSEGDLGRVAFRNGRLDVPSSVQCGDWIAVRSVARGRIEVSRCRVSSCGPFLEWSRSWGRAFTPPAQPTWPRPASSDWLLWTAAGVLASTTTGVVLWQAGMFEREGPRRERFEFVPPARR